VLQFDLSTGSLAALPPADIDSVRLCLYVLLSRIKTPAPCSVHALRSDWSEMQVTWSNAADATPWHMIPESGNDDTFALEDGGDMDPAPLATALSVPGGSWQYFNVTAIVDSFVRSPAANHGFAIRSDAELQPQYYASSENPLQELRPKLQFFTNGVPVHSPRPVQGRQPMLRMTPEGAGFRLDIDAIGGFTLKLCDVSGRTVASFRGAGATPYRIPADAIPPGVLTAVLTTAGGSSAVRITTIH